MIAGICVYDRLSALFIPESEIACVEWGEQPMLEGYDHLGARHTLRYLIRIRTRNAQEIILFGEHARMKAEAERLSAWLHTGKGVFDIRTEHCCIEVRAMGYPHTPHTPHQEGG